MSEYLALTIRQQLGWHTALSLSTRSNGQLRPAFQVCRAVLTQTTSNACRQLPDTSDIGRYPHRDDDSLRNRRRRRDVSVAAQSSVCVHYQSLTIHPPVDRPSASARGRFDPTADPVYNLIEMAPVTDVSSR
jgi:hypothetical protein